MVERQGAATVWTRELPSAALEYDFLIFHVFSETGSTCFYVNRNDFLRRKSIAGRIG